VLEAEQVQGNVLYAYGTTFRYARYVMVEFKNRIEVLDALRRWQPHITFGKPLAPRNPGCHVNVALTFEGFKLLEPGDEWLCSFPKDFREGARERSEKMGDSGESRADKWWCGKTEAVHHAIVVAHATARTTCDKLVDDLLGDIKPAWDTRAALLKRDTPGDPGAKDSCSTEFSREHFGFADGCSQPAIEGVHDDPVGGGL
jgi:deferrochelatase/peroxidase EfeB